MPELSSHFRQVTPYVPGIQPAPSPDLIKLNTNENPYPPSPAVKEALSRTSAERLRLYPSPEAEPLGETIGAYFGLSSSQIFTGNGSDEVLALAFLAFFADGKPVYFPDVTYSFYEVWADLFSIPFEKKRLGDDLRMVASDYAGAPGGIVFPNPNAPTGICEPLSFIEEILTANRDVCVIVDEAYIDFGGKSAISLIGKYDNLLVVQTFSKSRSLAGMRIGFAAGAKSLIERLKDVKYSFNSYTMSRVSIDVGCAAVKDHAYFEETREKIIHTRERMERALAALEFEFPQSQANFLFVRHPRIDAAVLYGALLEKKIYVRHFDAERTRDYLRITVGTDEETDVLLKFLTEYLKGR